MLPAMRTKEEGCSAPSALGSSSAQILRPREFSKAIQVCSVRKYQGWGAHESDIPLQSS